MSSGFFLDNRLAGNIPTRISMSRVSTFFERQAGISEMKVMPPVVVANATCLFAGRHGVKNVAESS